MAINGKRDGHTGREPSTELMLQTLPTWDIVSLGEIDILRWAVSGR